MSSSIRNQQECLKNFENLKDLATGTTVSRAAKTKFSLVEKGSEKKDEFANIDNKKCQTFFQKMLRVLQRKVLVDTSFPLQRYLRLQ